MLDHAVVVREVQDVAHDRIQVGVLLEDRQRVGDPGRALGYLVVVEHQHAQPAAARDRVVAAPAVADAVDLAVDVPARLPRLRRELQRGCPIRAGRDRVREGERAGRHADRRPADGPCLTWPCSSDVVVPDVDLHARGRDAQPVAYSVVVAVLSGAFGTIRKTKSSARRYVASAFSESSVIVPGLSTMPIGF